MTMSATVQNVDRNTLQVFEHAMLQTVIVHTPDACRFRVGDCVCIQYSGAMTMSIPPQITATSISLLSRCGPNRSPC